MGAWMALDLVEGVDLRAILGALAERGERMPLDCALHVVVGLTKALRHAHARRLPDGSVGLVHRDLSPGNVMVSFDGEVMLTDFGLAKVKHGERTRTGHQKGKHEYMSPEQAMSEPLDGRSDLFALGILLYEMLAGERPFDGPTYLATQMRIVKGERRPIREVVRGLPSEVEALVEKLLSVERAARYPSADDVLDAVGRSVPSPLVVLRLGHLAQLPATQRR
jgi:serine/threonine protein kinase